VEFGRTPRASLSVLALNLPFLLQHYSGNSRLRRITDANERAFNYINEDLFVAEPEIERKSEDLLKAVIALMKRCSLRNQCVTNNLNSWLERRDPDSQDFDEESSNFNNLNTMESLKIRDYVYERMRLINLDYEPLHIETSFLWSKTDYSKSSVGDMSEDIILWEEVSST
jgi:hypothetical protein